MKYKKDTLYCHFSAYTMAHIKMKLQCPLSKEKGKKTPKPATQQCYHLKDNNNIITITVSKSLKLYRRTVNVHTHTNIYRERQRHIYIHTYKYKSHYKYIFVL